MATNQCEAITRKGERCPNYKMKGSNFCFTHNHSEADKRHGARVRGGQGSRKTVRAMKAVPADLKDVGDTILQAIRDVHGDDLAPAKANAIANLSRAYVAVHDAGQVDARVKELVAELEKRGVL